MINISTFCPSVSSCFICLWKMCWRLFSVTPVCNVFVYECSGDLEYYFLAALIVLGVVCGVGGVGCNKWGGVMDFFGCALASSRWISRIPSVVDTFVKYAR